MPDTESNQPYKLTVKLYPGSKIEKWEWSDDSGLRIHIKAHAVNGQANKALIKLLSKLFTIPASDISIIKGIRSQIKLIEVFSDPVKILSVLNSKNNT